MKKRRYCLWLIAVAMLLLIGLSACTIPEKEEVCTVRFDAQ